MTLSLCCLWRLDSPTHHNDSSRTMFPTAKHRFCCRVLRGSVVRYRSRPSVAYYFPKDPRPCLLLLAIESDSRAPSCPRTSWLQVSNLSPIDTQDQTCYVAYGYFDKFRHHFRVFRNEVQSNLRKIRNFLDPKILDEMSFFTKGCHRCGYGFR